MPFSEGKSDVIMKIFREGYRRGFEDSKEILIDTLGKIYAKVDNQYQDASEESFRRGFCDEDIKRLFGEDKNG